MAGFRQLEDKGAFILYDPDLIPQIQDHWFQLDYWQSQAAVLGGAPGRGTSCFLQTPAGEAVWRHYHRGGLPGRLIKDRYLWTGLKQTRAWQEMYLTRELLDRGLPVPTPLAARVKRQGLTYQADLMTLRIPAAVPLSDYLLEVDEQRQQQVMQLTAQCVARFHQQGLNHSDLNPRNLLIQPQDNKIWLIDFDRCQLGSPNPNQAASNLARLYRGLRKLDPVRAEAWYQQLLSSYQQA